MNSAFLSPSVLRPAPKNSSTSKCSYGRSVDCPDIVCLRGRGLRLFVAATDGVLFSPIAVSIHSNREISWSPMLSSTRRSALPKAPSWTGLALDYRCPLRRAVRNRSTILMPPALNAPAGLVDDPSDASVCQSASEIVSGSDLWRSRADMSATVLLSHNCHSPPSHSCHHRSLRSRSQNNASARRRALDHNLQGPLRSHRSLAPAQMIRRKQDHPHAAPHKWCSTSSLIGRR
jgi:hypothetical protein